MTISELAQRSPEQIYVWIWLPDAVEPVVCGRLDAGAPITFTYARSYKQREQAVPVFGPELPLGGEPPLRPLDGSCMAHRSVARVRRRCFATATAA